jgi:hypothetical protein
LIERSEFNDFGGQVSAYIIDSLFDALEEYAPPYGYFGAYGGVTDDETIGFWLIEDFHSHFKEPNHINSDRLERILIHDVYNIPKTFTGEALLINYSGHYTLYTVNAGRRSVVWEHRP